MEAAAPWNRIFEAHFGGHAVNNTHSIYLRLCVGRTLIIVELVAAAAAVGLSAVGRPSISGAANTHNYFDIRNRCRRRRRRDLRVTTSLGVTFCLGVPRIAFVKMLNGAEGELKEGALSSSFHLFLPFVPSLCSLPPSLPPSG